jgi:putative phosphoribosyl transferase
MTTFRDRIDAGRRLAELIPPLQDPIVLGLPRGGVPVAAEVARRLEAPLDVLIVRKVGVPGQPEVAMGAIGEAGARVVDDRTMRLAGASADDFSRIEAQESDILQRRVAVLRAGRTPLRLDNRTAVIVDDGIATGATARAACLVARQLGARRVVVAAPVASADAIVALQRAADGVVVAFVPDGFRAVGQYYDDFTPTEDDEVERLLVG